MLAFAQKQSYVPCADACQKEQDIWSQYSLKLLMVRVFRYHTLAGHQVLDDAEHWLLKFEHLE